MLKCKEEKACENLQLENVEHGEENTCENLQLKNVEMWGEKNL